MDKQEQEFQEWKGRTTPTPLLNCEETVQLANAAMEIFEAIATDMFGSLAEAEDVPAFEIVECSFTADRIRQFAHNEQLAETWETACELDYREAKSLVTAELKRLWGF